MQMGEQRKKMKAQKNPIELTITEDDTELVVDKVQDQGEEALYVTESQREELMKKIMEVKEVLESLQLNVTHQRSTTQQVPIHEERETVQT
jgi:nucleoside-triphosphatase THEP1